MPKRAHRGNGETPGAFAKQKSTLRGDGALKQCCKQADAKDTDGLRAYPPRNEIADKLDRTTDHRVTEEGEAGILRKDG